MVHGRASSNLVRIELEIEGDVVFATHPNGLPFGAALTVDAAVTSPDEAAEHVGGEQ